VKKIICCFLLLFTVGCGRQLRKQSSDWLEAGQGVAEQKGDSARGRVLYNANCAVCHGTAGDGNGPRAASLNPRPRNFVSGEYKFKTTERDEPPSDLDLFRTITVGIPGTAMSGASKLSEKERWDLVAYIKSLAKDPATHKNIFQSNHDRHILKIEEPGFKSVGREARIKAGETLFFSKGKCYECHGPGPSSRDRLPQGDGSLANGLVDDWGFPIRPTNLAGGVLKRGNDPKEIYLTLTTGLMGTPMPSFIDTLTDEERWNLAYYISNLNRTHKEQK